MDYTLLLESETDLVSPVVEALLELVLLMDMKKRMSINVVVFTL